MAKPNLLAFWDAALEHELGLFIRTSDAKNLRVDLYQARKAKADPRHTDIAVFLPNRGDCLLMIRKSVELDP